MTRIQSRRDTATNWSSTNPILALGEIGIEIDTHKMKIGDGITLWNNLQYSTCPVDGSQVSIKINRDTDTNLITNDPIIPSGELMYNVTTGALVCGDGESHNSELPDIRKQFQNVVTVAKNGKNGTADFICSDSKYTDDAECIQAALNHVKSVNGSELKLLSGHYNCASQLLYDRGNISITGQGESTILDFSTIPAETFDCIKITGTITTTNSLLTSNASVGDLTITVADGTLFSTGDWIRIRSEGRYLTWDNEGTTVWQTVGEIQQIESINVNVLTLKEKVLGSYLITDTATVDIVEMLENIKVSDLKIIATYGVSHKALAIYNAVNVTIENVVTEDVYHSGLYIYNVVGASINKNIVRRSTEPGRGYGLMVANCSRDITGESNHFFDVRHGIACGGDYHYGVQYNQTYIANTISYDKHTVGLFGPHPTYDGFEAIGNTCYNCSLGYFNGPNNIVIGNYVKSNTVGGILLSEHCENSVVADNIIVVTSTGEGIVVKSTKSGIDIHDNNITVPANRDGISVGEQIKRIKIHDNIIKSGGGGIYVYTTSGDYDSDRINITHNDIECTGTDPGIKIESTDKNILNLTINDNDIKSIVDGIYLNTGVGGMSNLDIFGNRITPSASNSSIYFGYTTSNGIYTNTSIKNNKCYGGINGISVNGFDKLVISENDIYDATTNGISLRSTGTNYKIPDNNLYNCATPIADGIHADNKIISDNYGYNPVGIITAPSVPASGTAYTNRYGYPCRVLITSGTVTNTALNGTATGITSGLFYLAMGDSITLTYSSAPTWVWWGL